MFCNKVNAVCNFLFLLWLSVDRGSKKSKALHSQTFDAPVSPFVCRQDPMKWYSLIGTASWEKKPKQLISGFWARDKAKVADSRSIRTFQSLLLSRFLCLVHVEMAQKRLFCLHVTLPWPNSRALSISSVGLFELPNDSFDYLSSVLYVCICRDPKVLPCLHSFCEQCLEDSLAKSNIGPGQAFLCPICHSEAVVPKRGVSAMQVRTASW